VIVEVTSRRYKCQACGAVAQVFPGGIVRRRLYSAGAIALALALWSLDHLTPREVRRRVSPWRRVGATAAAGWASLRRWARAVRKRSLFRQVRAAAADLSLRAGAERAATTLAAFAPSSADALPLTTRAVLGATHVR
jgi:hypothetical protein